ncbi:MAG: autotransporter-associated beta strand repeat-containing protein, partial [Akkermansiaceae bacterium]|nr:autotransporter-associated beta strand repeat-containing protein [Akkermansiaceae bacterium]
MKINRSNPLLSRDFRITRLFVQSSLAFVVSMTSFLNAADLVWDANGATATITNGAGTWDKTATNWWDGATNVAWTDGNTAVIGSSTVAGAGGVINFTDTVDITVASLKVGLNGNATKYTLSPPTTGSMKFTVNSGITAEDGITINQPIFWGGDQTLLRTSSGAGALVITGSLDDDFIPRNLSLSSALGNATLGIVLRGQGGHDGTTTLNDGYFQARHDSFGTSEITLNGTIGAAQRIQFVNAAGSGVSGTLDNAVKLVTGKEGNFHIWGGFTTTVSSPITGGDATSVLRKNDSGTLLLAAANTYIGATIIDNGTLQLGDAGSILSTSGVTIAGTGILTIGGSGNVSTTAKIPSNIVFSAAASRLNTQGTTQSDTVTIDQDLGTATTLGQLRVTNGTTTLASGADLILNFVSVGHTPTSSGNIGTLNVGSGSTITLPGGNTNALFTGDSSGNAGIVNITGGSVSAPLNNSSGAVRIGHWAGAGSELNISGGSLSVPAGRINIGWDGSGTLNMTGGTMTAFAISVDGNGAGPACTANLNGGEILIGPNGISTAGQGTLVANGGKITATASNGWSVPRTINAGGLNANFGTGTTAITITDNSVTTGSGPLNITTDGGADKQYAINTNSPGYSGAISVASGIRLNVQQANALGTGTTTIASGAGAFLTATGTIPTNFRIEGTGWSETTGLLGAMRFQGSTVSGSITVEPAGARITAHTGAVGTHTGTLLGNSALEINSPVVGNNGTINLNGNGSTFLGPVTVSQGRLNLGGSLGGSLSVVDGATLGGEGSIAGNLTLGAATGSTLAINPNTPGRLSVAGAVSLSGINSLVFTVAPTTPGPIPVFSHGGLTGTLGTELVIATPGNYRTATWSDVAGLVSLDLGNKNLTWTGSGSSTWDLGVSTNWADPAASSFYWADSVTFGESSAPAVTLSGLLAPAAITVQSNTTNYTLTSSSGNQLTGNGTLLKTGDSILTMVGANAYTAGTTLSRGQIYLRTTGTLGSGTVTLGDANTGSSNIALYLDTNRVNFGTPIVVSSLATGTVTLGSRNNVVGTGDNNQFTNITLQRDVIFDANAADRTDFENITGTGNITVNGTGRAVFAVANTFVGNLTLNNTNALGLQLGTNSAAFNAIPDATNVTISAGSTLSVSYTAGGNETIAGLNGAGTLRNNGGFANSLTVGTGGASGSFSGTIINGGAGALSFTKTGAGTQALLGTASSHTGITTVSGGVLEVSTLANGGSNSSIGASTNAATNLVLAGATLRHVGAASSTDRSLTVGTASSIEASGTGALAFINPAAITLSGTDTARTFTLGGTNTGANTFTSIIPNNGTGATTVAKSGSGTWALTGSNTFTGPLQINGGKLNLSFIGNGGSASQVGQSTKVGSNLLLNGGTLGYTGVTAATDRAFATGTSGGTIEV